MMINIKLIFYIFHIIINIFEITIIINDDKHKIYILYISHNNKCIYLYIYIAEAEKYRKNKDQEKWKREGMEKYGYHPHASSNPLSSNISNDNNSINRNNNNKYYHINFNNHYRRSEWNINDNNLNTSECKSSYHHPPPPSISSITPILRIPDLPSLESPPKNSIIKPKPDDIIKQEYQRFIDKLSIYFFCTHTPSSVAESPYFVNMIRMFADFKVQNGFFPKIPTRQYLDNTGLDVIHSAIIHKCRSVCFIYFYIHNIYISHNDIFTNIYR